MVDAILPPVDESDRIRLLGSRCRRCGEAFYPSRLICKNCSAQESEAWEFGPEGFLYTYTIVRDPPGVPPRAFGEAEFAAKVRVQGRILVEDFGSLRIGMPVELVLRPASDGRPAGFAFRPWPLEGAS